MIDREDWQVRVVAHTDREIAPTLGSQRQEWTLSQQTTAHVRNIILMKMLTRSTSRFAPDHLAFAPPAMPRITPSAAVRRGYTLIELLVTIAIAAILMAMILPAMQRSRDTARRSRCAQNLSQLGLALHAYHDTFTHLPAGCVNARGPVQLAAEGFHHSWIIPLLPYLDEAALAERIDPTLSIYAAQQLPARQVILQDLVCPADPVVAMSTEELGSVGLSSYAGSHHHKSAAIDINNTGLLFLNRVVRFDDIPDGTSFVYMLGEIRRNRDTLGWASGTRSTLRNTGRPINATPGGKSHQDVTLEESDSDLPDQLGPGWDELGDSSMSGAGSVEETAANSEPRPPAPPTADVAALDPGGFGSHHTGGCHFLMGDGRVQFVSDSIDMNVYRRLAHRSDRMVVEPQ